MAGISQKKLTQIEKTLEAVFVDDEEGLEALQKSLAGFHAAIEKGERVTMDDITEVLGEVWLEKMNDGGDGDRGSGNVDPDEGNDPVSTIVGPAMLGLYKSLFDDKGRISKSAANPQEAFDKAFQGIVAKLLPEFDAAIEAAAEATAIELGEGDRVNFGKAKRKPFDPEDEADGGADEDMEKLMKALGVGGESPIVKGLVSKMQKQAAQIESLQTERDLEVFSKAAEDIGEGKGFGATLLKLHKLDPKLADEVKKRLGSKNEALRKNDLWSREIGDGGSETGTSLEQLNAKASEIQKAEKGANGKPLTFAKAFTEACDRHPDLYQDYTKEQSAKRR